MVFLFAGTRTGLVSYIVPTRSLSTICRVVSPAKSSMCKEVEKAL
jgi:hypothetical protein